MYLPFMSLFSSSNKMWFLAYYLPTFSDNVTLFTVFFLKSSLMYLMMRSIIISYESNIAYVQFIKFLCNFADFNINDNKICISFKPKIPELILTEATMHYYFKCHLMENIQIKQQKNSNKMTARTAS